MRTALITGITGQDGSYLSEFLLNKGYHVYGVLKRSSVFTTERIEHLNGSPRFETFYGDMTDSSNLNQLVGTLKPDEVYNLAAQSHVGVSFDVPEYTAQATGVGTLRLLDAIIKSSPSTKFYQASTSELFGGLPQTAPQNESTPFYPKSPYGVAKLYSYWICQNYREAYGLYACNGILFNHESPRRGLTFVTRKISVAVAKIKLGLQDKLILGNLDARRDWGHAKDYVKAMWLMLQQDQPKDFVIATGRTSSVREFCELAFNVVGIEIAWKGSGVDEVGRDSKTGKILIEVSKEYFRPAEVELLWGDPSKANTELGWRPSCSLEDLVEEMVTSDIQHIQSPRALI